MAQDHKDTLTTPGERKKVLFATLIGTSIEWYDFFIYAFMSAIVFNKIFFAPLKESMGDAAPTLLAVATIGLSFLFRPFGAFLAGHLGDRIGRKPVLMLTLIMMGVATALIGLLPTGLFGALCLILLRVLQGISTGGEWGGAALMAVETAKPEHRNRAGAWPQLGVPLGMLLATAMLTVLRQVVSPEDFLSWGWRIPFLFSVVLIIIGYLVRRVIEESPVFKEIGEITSVGKAPIGQMFRKHWYLVIFAALAFSGDNAVGYMLVGGVVNKYATRPLAEGGLVGMDPATVAMLLNISAIVWAITTYVGAWLADKSNARIVFIGGYILMAIASAALFPLVVMGKDNPIYLLLGICFLGIPLGFCYGPLSAWYAEIFPASCRVSGVSITYAIGAVIGGAFAPLIVQAIFEAHKGDWFYAAVYLVAMCGVGLVGSLALPNRHNIPLGLDMEKSGKWDTWRGGDLVPEGVRAWH